MITSSEWSAVKEVIEEEEIEDESEHELEETQEDVMEEADERELLALRSSKQSEMSKG